MSIFTCCCCCHVGADSGVSRFRTHSALVPVLSSSVLQCAPIGPALSASCGHWRVGEADGCVVRGACTHPPQTSFHYGLKESLAVD